ncbi:unnamed protein product [Kuraishia capsulata CBS 1993]|uniref:Translation initiation factor eIF2B subunit gamma n=1 Tax=Kuraishia capsulata CBS 1993 TaxID=1382522 RepID=W6MG71_9ASCO|nr:uncharacterized protein KUCA_T00000717001 [Kuraishia capsulata CBS 1993]CDK24751.1 unnamed protein product [Kuraishia capsulata CBS 1993]
MEFHAVIFCGDGSDLAPFSATRESGIPKASLPIANRAMLEYVLEWCDQAPFKQVTVACNKDDGSIAKIVETYKAKRDPELVQSSGMDYFLFESSNTGSALTALKDRLNMDTVILPCDFITDLPPQVLIEAYRSRDDVDLGMGVHYNNTLENLDKKTLKTGYTIYATQEDGSICLLDLYSKQSVSVSKALKVRTQMLWRFPRASVSTKLLDSSIFFFSKKVPKILEEEKVAVAGRSITKVKRELARRSWKHGDPKETLGLFIAPDVCTFARCNNLAVYMEVNRWFLKAMAKNIAGAGHGHMAPKEKGAATVGADSLVGDGTELGERTSVKRSVVGKNCRIGKRCRLTGCILMDNVVLEDDVQLENCIVGLGAQLHSKCRLTNCNVEGSYIVAKSTQVKGETLLNITLSGLVNVNTDSSDEYDSEAEGDSDNSYDDDRLEEFEDDIDDGLFG